MPWETKLVDFGAQLGGLGTDLAFGNLASGVWATNGTPSNYSITMADIQRSVAEIAHVRTASSAQTVYQQVAYQNAQINWPWQGLGQQAGFTPSLGWYQSQMNQMVNGLIYQTYGSQPPETPEQRIAREEREVKRLANLKAAECRAEHLMFAIINSRQKKQYEDHGWFETEVNDKVYRIHKRSHSANVELIVNGKPVAKYCAHPSQCYETPTMDTMIAQLLMLQTDEKRFLATANKTVLYA